MATKEKTFITPTKEERILVTKLILPHKSTLLDTRNTPEVIEAKRHAWTQITEEFNKWPKAICFRSTNTLQTMWLRVKSDEKTRLRKLAAEGHPKALLTVSTFKDPVVNNEFTSNVPKTKRRYKKHKPSKRERQLLLPRKRDVNFTDAERELLPKLVDRYKSVIYSKKGDNETKQLKRAAWKRVKVALNDANIGPKRPKFSIVGFMRSYNYKNKLRGICDLNEHIDERDFEKTKALLAPDLLTMDNDSDSDDDAMDNDRNKQTRSKKRCNANFTPAELEWLDNRVNRYKSVIISREFDLKNAKIPKKTLKAAAWKRVTKEFNAAELGQPRDEYDLKMCWKQRWQKRKVTLYQPKPGEFKKITAILMQDLGDKDPQSTQPRRKPNFTANEIRQLVRLIRPHLKIVENKSSETRVIRKKRETWKKIADKFNDVCKSFTRSPKDLTACWKTFKYKTRKAEQKEIESSYNCEIDIDLDYDFESYDDIVISSPDSTANPNSTCKSETIDDIADDSSSLPQIRSTTSECSTSTSFKQELEKSDNVKVVRRRRPNFTMDERKRLIRLVRVHYSSFGNYSTTFSVIEKKRAEWDKITIEYNKQCETQRNKSELKAAWRSHMNNMKRKGRQLLDSPDISDKDNKFIDSEDDKPHNDHGLEAQDDHATPSPEPMDDSANELDFSDQKDDEPSSPRMRIDTIPRRKPNFTPDDKKQLLRIIRPYYTIVENKSTQTSVRARKRVTWKKITHKYNQVCQLQRTKYELVRCWGKFKHECDLNEEVESPDEATIQSPNYTPHENKMLFRFIRPHLKDVENKSGTEADLIKKNAAWKTIAKQYNYVCKTHRTSTELRKHWLDLSKLRRSGTLPRQYGIHLGSIDLESGHNEASIDLESGHDDSRSATPDFAEDFLDLIPPIDSKTTNDQIFGENLPNFQKSFTQTHETAPTTSVPRETNQATTSAAPIILNSFVSGSDAPSIRAFFCKEMINGVDSLVQEDPSFVHTPLLLNKYEQYINAKITLEQTQLEILRENARLKEEREQEGYDFRKTLNDMLFRQITEQEDEIHELMVANLRYDLLQMGKELI